MEDDDAGAAATADTSTETNAAASTGVRSGEEALGVRRAVFAVSLLLFFGFGAVTVLVFTRDLTLAWPWVAVSAALTCLGACGMVVYRHIRSE